MRKIIALILGAAALASLAYGTEWAGDWKPLNATYTIYSGELSERAAPTTKERTLTVLVEGKPAKDIFDSIGPDRQPTCGSDPRDRERHKKGVQCSYAIPTKGTKDSYYRCWIGLNLRTGDSIPTVAC